MAPTLTPPPQTVELTAADRCDRCGAQARVRAILPSGDLLFCAHHAQQYETQLKTAAVQIIDQRSQLHQELASPER